MVRVAIPLIATATLAHIQSTAAVGTLRSVPDLAELEAVDGGVFVGRQDLAAYGYPEEDQECVLSDWTPEGDCDGKTLTQKFKRTVLTQPSEGGEACEEMVKIEPCKPVHCRMGAWSDWSACDPNGFKTRTRTVDQQPLYGGRECPYAEDKVKCRKQDCRVCEWSEWTCDSKTEKKTRTRHITRPAELDGKPCPHLTEEEKCDPVHCKYNPYAFEEWTECFFNGTLPYIKTRRNKVIQEALYGGEPCPIETQECPPIDCKYNEKAENDDKFGECLPDDASEKVWHRHKTYKIAQNATYGGQECNPEDGDIEELCDPVDCDYKENSGTFEECKEDLATGSWYKTKQLEVKTNPLYGGEACYKDGKGFVVEKCDPVHCSYKENSGTFKPCEEDLATGSWYKTKQLDVDVNPMYGGEACYKDGKGIVVEKCDPVHCKYKEKTGVFEDCKKDEVSGKWFKKEVLGIETHPMYGGRECQESDGVIEEECTPVPCVPDEYGEWTECNAKGEKERWREIITEALYGGTCVPQSEEATCEKQNCEIAGENDDDDWGSCDTNGFKHKTLRIKKYPRFGGVECDSEEKRQRKKPCEKVDCVVGDWDKWSACDSNDERERTRSALTRALYGGKECPNLKETEKCEILKCVYDEWSAWSECGDNNKRTRTRKVLLKPENDASCVDQTQEEECEKVDCIMSDWTPWSSCSYSRTQTRSREIIREAKNGGKKCGKTEQSRPCNGGGCRVGDWGPWGPCKYGKKTRTRPCSNSNACDEEDRQTSETVDCDVDCILTDWTEPPCDAQTGTAISERRVLVKETGNGKCPTDLTRTITCAPINCVLNDWTEWEACDPVTHKRTRRRSIALPPKYGGTPCPDEESSARKQTEDCAKVDCVVSEWSGWSECVRDGEAFKQTRTKTKLAGPLNGGAACPLDDELTETRECPKVNCRSEWGPWTKCENGKKSRKRTVVEEAKYGGNACPTKVEEEARCEAEPVPPPNAFGPVE